MVVRSSSFSKLHRVLPIVFVEGVWIGALLMLPSRLRGLLLSVMDAACLGVIFPTATSLSSKKAVSNPFLDLNYLARRVASAESPGCPHVHAALQPSPRHALVSDEAELGKRDRARTLVCAHRRDICNRVL